MSKADKVMLIFCIVMIVGIGGSMVMNAIFGPDEKTQAEQTKKEVEAYHQQLKPDMWVITIDSCEYFEWVDFRNVAHITHKGNCRNKIHIYNKTGKQ